jgi:hypothetical protein
MALSDLSLRLLLASPRAAPFVEWSSAFGWLFALSIGSLVITLLLLPVIVVRLPPDYFVGERPKSAAGRGSWIVRVGKNVLGVVFLLAGLAMIVLPGQGLLTVLIGLLLVDFPGKRKLERKFVRRPRILKFLNKMRSKRGKPPLVVD